jgi:hypothetical protein
VNRAVPGKRNEPENAIATARRTGYKSGMPQRQLPIFPAGVTEINSSIAVQREAGQVWYIHGHLPVFHHEEADLGSFRMFTSQMIVNGTVRS